MREELEEYLRSDKFRFQGSSQHGATWETKSGTWETVGTHDMTEYGRYIETTVVAKAPDGTLWTWDFVKDQDDTFDEDDYVAAVTATTRVVTTEYTDYTTVGVPLFTTERTL